eukprot:TRINITY_DN4983_c0_g1_i1.p1 TRINITY_DN4983_c0_g1~~TRINITY_DN4983_c0_g1_i1.p1  ORF type:complete len:583 (-),score=244.40 TRINITY_DN4983_c0_g1_i1:35-1783(-)
MSEKTKEKKDKKEKKAKKEKKQEKRQELELAGYSDQANPWGDANLSETFVWKAKRDKERQAGLDPDAVSKEKDDIRRSEALKEIERVKRRRLEREEEKKRWEEERARLQREKEQEEFKDWERNEDAFLLKQAQLASEIRMREGRAKPIDIIYKNVNRDSSYAVDSRQPYEIFAGLPLSELEALTKDIAMYLELDVEHREFWLALRLVADHELHSLRQPAAAADQRALRAVSDDVSHIFQAKSFNELQELEKQVQGKLRGDDAVDVEYWEALLKRLTVHKAKAKLREVHAQLVKQRADARRACDDEQLQPRQPAEGAAAEPSAGPYAQRAASTLFPLLPDVDSGASSHQQLMAIDASTAAPVDEPSDDDDDAGRGAERPDDEPSDSSDSIDARRRQLLEEAQRLRARTAAAADGGGAGGGGEKMMSEAEMMRHQADLPFEDDEEVFAGEQTLAPRVYAWSDKYRPRKPKYYNRVHTGYEWNKYNQTHYDQDNPPPKIVQGYKFNIFYPDLIEKNKAPRYFIEPHPDSPDFVILRFSAGPPYEDLAFVIANKEWEYSHKNGFRCSFERGILHLWVNFRRYRYRR